LRARQRPGCPVRAGDGRDSVPTAAPAGLGPACGPAFDPDPVETQAQAMNRDVLIVGAGMGGLAAAVRLARSGFRVQVLEARSGPGGLAAGVEFQGFPFDAGPYILLDRPGLEWAFRSVGLELAERVALRPLTDV